MICCLCDLTAKRTALSLTLPHGDRLVCWQVLPFVHRVLHGPGAGTAAGQALGPVLLGAIWRVIQEGSSSLALPLLLDACQALRPQVSSCHAMDRFLLARTEHGRIVCRTT